MCCGLDSQPTFFFNLDVASLFEAASKCSKWVTAAAVSTRRFLGMHAGWLPFAGTSALWLPSSPESQLPGVTCWEQANLVKAACLNRLVSPHYVLIKLLFIVRNSSFPQPKPNASLKDEETKLKQIWPSLSALGINLFSPCLWYAIKHKWMLGSQI